MALCCGKRKCRTRVSRSRISTAPCASGRCIRCPALEENSGAEWRGFFCARRRLCCRKSLHDAPPYRRHFLIRLAKSLESALELGAVSLQEPLVRRDDFGKLGLVSRQLLLEL